MGFNYLETGQKQTKMATKPLLTPTEGRKLVKRIDIFQGDLEGFKQYYNEYPHKIFATQCYPNTNVDVGTTGDFFCIIFYEIWI